MTSKHTYCYLAASPMFSFHTEVLRKGFEEWFIHGLYSADLKGKCNMCFCNGWCTLWCIFISVSCHRVLENKCLVSCLWMLILLMKFQISPKLLDGHLGRKLCFLLAEFRVLWSYLHHWNIYIMVIKQYLPKNFHVILFKNKSRMKA